MDCFLWLLNITIIATHPCVDISNVSFNDWRRFRETIKMLSVPYSGMPKILLVQVWPRYYLWQNHYRAVREADTRSPPQPPIGDPEIHICRFLYDAYLAKFETRPLILKDLFLPSTPEYICFVLFLISCSPPPHQETTMDGLCNSTNILATTIKWPPPIPLRQKHLNAVSNHSNWVSFSISS